jgi:hypothetical protein
MQVLLLGKEIRTPDEVVQVTAELPAGDYLAELLVVDAAGERASASVVFTITNRLIAPVPPVTPLNPTTPTRPGRTPRARRGHKPG